MRNFIALGLLLFVSSAQSALVTIDFEEFTDIDVALNPPSGDATSKGYTLDYLDQGSGNPVIFGAGSSLNGTQTYVNCPSCQSPEIIDVYETLGGTLTLLSIDIGTMSGAGADSHTFMFTGTKGGGTVTKTVSSIPATMQTISFDGSWNNLDSFRIEISPNGELDLFSASVLDNIVINTVPVPAAIWLFGSALAGLGWLRRTRAV